VGANAEYLCLPEKASLTRMPQGLSFEEAAAAVDHASTAPFFLRDKGKVRPGQRAFQQPTRHPVSSRPSLGRSNRRCVHGQARASMEDADNGCANCGSSAHLARPPLNFMSANLLANCRYALGMRVIGIAHACEFLLWQSASAGRFPERVGGPYRTPHPRRLIVTDEFLTLAQILATHTDRLPAHRSGHRAVLITDSVTRAWLLRPLTIS
jgi:hypothetical protein